VVGMTRSSSTPSPGMATAIGANRTIWISNGRFSGTFKDGNAIHIFWIESGSTGEAS
jgi:hypothetical protein